MLGMWPMVPGRDECRESGEMCGAGIDKQRVTPRRVTRYVFMEYIRLHNDMAWTHTKSLPFFD
jgi:hypothetical protein